MVSMKRLYKDIILAHFKEHRQMLFLMGPRQVGKTTTSMEVLKELGDSFYFNWDNEKHRDLIISGTEALSKEMNLHGLLSKPILVVFDEIHKYAKWKNFLKGLYDTFPTQVRILVTGSARLDYVKKGGDSLMGRYLRYRFHPFSIAEILHTDIPKLEIRPEPLLINEEQFESLVKFGGFPDPFLKNSQRFWNQWKGLRAEQLFREDLRDLTRIQEIAQLETLAEVLRHQAGQLTSYDSLSKKVRVSSNTIRNWIQALRAFYYCFELRPWSKNIARSLLKEPKYYLWDWSLCEDEGMRNENFIASHLLKAVHFWTDYGFGDFQLFYLRDKEKREVDFVITKNQKPWILVEAKSTNNKEISSSLKYFHHQTQAPYAFQVVMDLPFVDQDCFQKIYPHPIQVPAKTLLSQLV